MAKRSGGDGKGKLSQPDIRKGETQPSAANPEERAQFLILSANRLMEQERPEDALPAMDEAVAIWRRLAAVRPDPSRPALALALGVRGSVLAAMERHDDAVESLADALRTLTPLLEKDAGPVAPLAMSLFRDYMLNVEAAEVEPDHALLRPIADVLMKAGFDIGEEGRAAATGFNLDAPPPPASEPENLAQYLIARSRHLNELGHHDAALEAIDEAVDVWRPLCEQGKPVGAPGLALALGLRGDVLRGLVRTDEAAESFAEGLRVITPLFVEKPKIYVTLASALFRDYIACTEESGEEVDEDMILPAFEVLRDLGVIDVEDEGEGAEDDDEEDERRR
jgi:tetratricopeptide (TPR) repeat protein